MMQGHLNILSAPNLHILARTLFHTRWCKSLADLEARQVFDPFAVGAAVRTGAFLLQHACRIMPD